MARFTIRPVEKQIFEKVEAAISDKANWVGLQGTFDYERSLADWIATYPHRLQDGLMPFPKSKVRERVFVDRTRSDVLLIDQQGLPVVVECKQGAPTVNNLEQLRGYMAHVRKITGRETKGLLVHGGSSSLREDVRREVARDSRIKIIRYVLQVDFAAST